MAVQKRASIVLHGLCSPEAEHLRGSQSMMRFRCWFWLFGRPFEAVRSHSTLAFGRGLINALVSMLKQDDWCQAQHPGALAARTVSSLYSRDLVHPASHFLTVVVVDYSCRLEARDAPAAWRAGSNVFTQPSANLY